MKSEDKDIIAKNFSKYSERYDQYAKAQKRGADFLIEDLDSILNEVPEGPILEIGCGTGSLSYELVKRFPDRRIILSDISPGMLARCKQKLESSGIDISGVSWIEMDGENAAVDENFALILSGSTFQWFRDIEKSIVNLTGCLTEGGWLLYSFFGKSSFPEWKNICDRINIPYTGNPLPTHSGVISILTKMDVTSRFNIEDVELSYESSRDFFRSLKLIGAGTNLDKKPLTAGQMRKLIRTWDEESNSDVRITYRINYAKVRKG